MPAAQDEFLVILTRTPAVFRALLAGLEVRLTDADYGPNPAHAGGGRTWSAREIVAHMLFNERTDWLLSAELALMGPILNVPDLLAHRTKPEPPKVDRAAFRRRLDPSAGERPKTTATSLTRDLPDIARAADLTPSELRHCRKALGRFWLNEAYRINRMRAVDLVNRTVPGFAERKRPQPDGASAR